MDRQIRILLADGNEEFCGRLKQTLEEDGRFAVVGVAGDGVRACELMQSCHPDVLALDLMLPKMDGIAVLKKAQELESAPRIIKFSPDGRFAYLICELKNYISVYTYKDGPRGPVFELVQTLSTLNEYHSKGSAACVLRFSRDWNYVLCSNAGDNSVGIFKIDRETGMLEKICILPVSGDYPKAADFFPDNRHIMALNHESNTMTIFRINYEKKYFSLWGKPLKVETPNCVLVSEIEEAPKQ